MKLPPDASDKEQSDYYGRHAASGGLVPALKAIAITVVLGACVMLAGKLLWIFASILFTK